MSTQDEKRLNPGQQSVLVLDDDPVIRELLECRLAGAGWDVRTTGNGREALEMWRSWRPRVVLLDRQMPILDGVQVARRIRLGEAELGGSRSILVSISGSVLPYEREQLRWDGFDGFVPKPFCTQDLLRALEGLLQGKIHP